jgi:hypothetical protein
VTNPIYSSFKSPLAQPKSKKCEFPPIGVCLLSDKTMRLSDTEKRRAPLRRNVKALENTAQRVAREDAGRTRVFQQCLGLGVDQPDQG